MIICGMALVIYSGNPALNPNCHDVDIIKPASKSFDSLMPFRYLIIGDTFHFAMGSALPRLALQ